MTDYFVSQGGANTDGSTWAKAYTSLQTALTAATVAGDRVIIQYNDIPSTDSALSADTTYTINADIIIISASNDGGSSFTPTPMGDTYFIGNSSASRAITVLGGYTVYIYGVHFLVASSTSKNLQVMNQLDGSNYTLDNCILDLQNTNSASRVRLGSTSGHVNIYEKLVNTTLRFGNASQTIEMRANIDFEFCKLHASTTAPTTLFTPTGTSSGYLSNQLGCDWSLATNTTLLANCTSYPYKIRLSDCKLPTGYTALATQTDDGLAAGTVELYNCATGDSHFEFGYYDSRGALTAVTSPYFNSGSATANALYDGANNICWQITTSATCSYTSPFFTPWIEKYHNGTSTITPYLEILRNGSNTALTNDQVWGEFTIQASANTVLPTFLNDKKLLHIALGSEPQANGSGTNYWSGANTTAAWSGKIDSNTAIAPTKIGMLRGRVYVGSANTTLYVDPYIRT